MVRWGSCFPVTCMQDLLVGERGASLAALEAATGARIMATDAGLVHVGNRLHPYPRIVASVICFGLACMLLS